MVILTLTLPTLTLTLTLTPDPDPNNELPQTATVSIGTVPAGLISSPERQQPGDLKEFLNLSSE